MDAVCRCGRARLSRGCHLRESAPCLVLQAAAPAEASLSLLLRGLCSLTRVLSPPLCCWSVSTSCCVCNHARADSRVEHTSAVSTVTVRDPCDQPSSSPRATSSRSPCAGSSCSSSSPGNPLLHSARGLARDQSSRRSATPPLQEESTVCRFHDISVWHHHVRDHTLAIHNALRSFTLHQCSCRYMTISAGYVCDHRLQVQ